MARDDVLVEVENLYMYFPLKGGTFQRKVADIKAVDGISFYIKRGFASLKSPLICYFASN